jgi:hypothetical protein
MPQSTAPDTEAREDLKTTEMSANHQYIYIIVANRPKTDYVCRAEDYNRDLTPSDMATELALELVYYRFNYNIWSHLS